MAEQRNKSVEQGDNFDDQGIKSADHGTELAWVPAVVGRGRLHAEADKQGDGFAASEANEQRPVTIDAIVVGEIAAVALHHVDVVHAPFGSKAEGRIAA